MPGGHLVNQAAWAGFGELFAFHADRLGPTRTTKGEIMANSDLTEAVCHAVVTAHSLVKLGQGSDGCDLPSLVVSLVESLDKHLVKSNDLAKHDPFIGQYDRPPESVSGTSGASHHAIGRNLAGRVFSEICSAADVLLWTEVLTGKAPRFDFGRISRNWSRVKAYLRNDAPEFDGGRLVANIQDEAARTAAVTTGAATSRADNTKHDEANAVTQPSRVEPVQIEPKWTERTILSEFPAMTELLKTNLRRLHGQLTREVDSGSQVAGLLICSRQVPFPRYDIREVLTLADLEVPDSMESEALEAAMGCREAMESISADKGHLWLVKKDGDFRRFVKLAKDVAHALHPGNDWDDWCRQVFRLAWEEIPGSTLRADRWTVKHGKRFVRPNKDDLDYSQFPEPFRAMVERETKDDPFLASALPDLVAASIYAIEILLNPPSAAEATKNDRPGPVSRSVAPSTVVKAKPSEGKGGAGSRPGQDQSPPATTGESVLRQLEPAVRKAYLAYRYAESCAERQLEDREAYDWLRENGFDQGKGDLGELTDYEIPGSLETFRRYLTAARKPLGESKYTRRGGRKHGRSITRGNEIEYQKGDDR